MSLFEKLIQTSQENITEKRKVGADLAADKADMEKLANASAAKLKAAADRAAGITPSGAHGIEAVGTDEHQPA